LTSRQTPPELAQSYGFGFSVGDGSFGHGGACSTDTTADTQRGLILVWPCSTPASRARGDKSQEAFKRAALEAFALERN
jgi:hypothetical protein